MDEIAPSSVRYKKNGEWVIVDPHDRFYSMAVFLAEEYWTGEKWIHANDVGDEDAQGA